MTDELKRGLAWLVLGLDALALVCVLVAAVATPLTHERPPRGPLPAAIPEGSSPTEPQPAPDPSLPVPIPAPPSPQPPSPSDLSNLRLVPSPDLDAREQAALERLNAVRADPPAGLPQWRAYLRAELAAGSACGESLDMLDPLSSYAPQQPLAANQALTDAARLHAKDMLDRDYFDHVNPEGVGPNQRVIAAGYPLPLGRPLYQNFMYAADKAAKNIESLHWYAVTTNAPFAFEDGRWATGIDALIVDACVPSRGHRDHLLGAVGLGPVEREVGVGIVTDQESVAEGTRHELELVVETGYRGDDGLYVLGVVYRDDGNGRYDPGEGVAGVAVVLAGAGLYTHTGPGGGYTLPVADGFAGRLAADVATREVSVSGRNVKIDVVLPHR